MLLAPALLIAVSAFGGGSSAAPPTTAASIVPVPSPVGDGRVADAVELVLRATVAIEGDGVYGAGILVDPPRGLVLTSDHVIEDMKRPRVTGYDGRSGVGKVIAVDRKLDLALLECPELVTPDLPRPRLADAGRLRPGEEVFAIGSPRKLFFTVSRGIVSFVGRPMDGARYLQLDMAINDGNSGGPVFTKDGEVVAVMSFILRRAQGLSFALPVAYASTAFAEHLGGEPPRSATFREWLEDPTAKR